MLKKNHISSEIRNYNELSENLGIDLRDTQKNKKIYQINLS